MLGLFRISQVMRQQRAHIIERSSTAAYVAVALGGSYNQPPPPVPHAVGPAATQLEHADRNGTTSTNNISPSSSILQPPWPGLIDHVADRPCNLDTRPTAASNVAEPAYQRAHHRYAFLTQKSQRLSAAASVSENSATQTSSSGYSRSGNPRGNNNNRNAGGAGGSELSHLAARPYTSLGRSMWDPLLLDTFEGGAKHQWVDIDRGWCYLCQEPVGGSLGVHLSDRDHVCLAVFIYMFQLFPRGAVSDPRQTLDHAFRHYHQLHQYATGAPMSQDHLHAVPDTVRRAELEAILLHLTGGPLGSAISGAAEQQQQLHRSGSSPASAAEHTADGKSAVSDSMPSVGDSTTRTGEDPGAAATTQVPMATMPPVSRSSNRARTTSAAASSTTAATTNSYSVPLSHALQGRAPLPLWVAGERIFKANIGRLASTMLPPMAPGTQSTFTQKCWGRSNLERMYDALNIARIHRSFGVEPKTTRDSRAFFMRTLFWELHAAMESRDLCDTADVLVRDALRRIAFEAMFLQSMYYMNRCQLLVAALDYPTLSELQQLQSV